MEFSRKFGSLFRSVFGALKTPGTALFTFLDRFYESKTNSRLTILLFLIVGLDQLIKYIILNWTSVSSGLPDPSPGLSLTAVFNDKFLFGLQIGKMDPLLTAVFFILLFTVLSFFYVVGLRWISSSFYIIKLGMTFLFGGVFGNLLDKIRYNQVLDFIMIQIPGGSEAFVANTADLFQTAGWGLLIYGAVKFRSRIWRPTERRKTFLIPDPRIKKYQLEFIGYISWIMVCIGFSFLLVTYKFLDFVGTADPSEYPHLAFTLMNYYFLLYVLFFILAMGLTIYFSNKIYGPVYAFQKHLKTVLEGESPPDIKLRKGDQFQEMEQLAVKIKTRLSGKHTDSV